ncbi:MAG: hypothetical protein H6684_01610 [Deltaproteobacteria bacterium]|nr:hypothetical protein [Deltaproteobacteria bacterium]
MSSLRSPAAMYVAVALLVAILLPTLIAPSDSIHVPTNKSLAAWMDAAIFDASARAAWDRWHMIPSLNPYVDGGVPLGSHPTDGTLSPISLLLLPISSAFWATKFKGYLAVVAGAVGLYLLARRLGAQREASLAASVLVPVSGWVQDKIAHDPLALQVLWAAPALAIVLHAPAKTLPALLIGGMVTMAAFQAGPATAFLFALFALAGWLRSRQSAEEREAGIEMMILALGTSFLLGSIKWFPLIEIVTRRNLRAAAASSGTTAGFWTLVVLVGVLAIVGLIATLKMSRTGRKQKAVLSGITTLMLAITVSELLRGHFSRAGRRYGSWHHTASTVAERLHDLAAHLVPGGSSAILIFVLVLAAGGAVTLPRKNATRRLAGVLFVFALLPAMTIRGGWAADFWNCLTGVSEPMSVTPIFLLIALGGLAALSFEQIVQSNRRFGRTFLVVFVLGMALAASRADHGRTFHVPEPWSPDRLDVFRDETGALTPVTVRPYRARPNDLAWHPMVLIEQQFAVTDALTGLRGARRMREAFTVRVRGNEPRLRRNPSYPGPVELLRGEGEILGVTEDADRFLIKVRHEKPDGRMHINRNYHHGWHVKDQLVPVYRAKSRVSVHLPDAGEHTLELRFTPSTLKYGAALSMVSLFVFLFFALIEAADARHAAHQARLRRPIR